MNHIVYTLFSIQILQVLNSFVKKLFSEIYKLN